MQSYNLFIACSSGARNVAAELWPRLVFAAQTKNLELHVERWWETVFTPGVSTLQSLIKQCNNVHFALVLFTKDDFSKGKGEKESIPRDNCIYEAGLFTGSFGPDPERCFLLTSCDEEALPTDLLGLTKIRIPSVPPGLLSDQHVQEISMAANTVVNAILKKKIKPRGVLPVPDSLLGRNRNKYVMAVAPVFGEAIQGDKWPDVFTLMPFLAEFRPVFDDHIKNACKNLNLTAGRADDFFSVGRIMDDVWSAIYSASIVIADCTGRNPNVFYEIGLAHTVGKDVILISQTVDDIPFDLRDRRVIVYDFTPRGMTIFEQKLQATFQAILRARDVEP